MNYKNIKLNRFLAIVLAVIVSVSVVPIATFTALAAEQTKECTFNVIEGLLPVEGATVTASSEGKPDVVATTSIIGRAKLNLYEDAEYTYKVSKFGYEVATGTVESTNVSVSLTPLDVVTVSGTVKDADTLTTIDNVTVSITGYESKSTETNALGEYSFSLYEGQDYDITLSHNDYKKISKKVDFVNSNDFSLEKKTTVIDYGFVKESSESSRVAYSVGDTIDKTALKNLPTDAEPTFTAEPAEAVDITNGVVTIVKAGDLVITATIAGTDQYLETEAELYVSASKGTINTDKFSWSTSVPADLPWNESFKNTLSTTAVEYTGCTVTYDIGTQTGVSVESDTSVVLFSKPGTYTITANISGNDNYNETTKSYDITVVKAEQNPGVSFDDNTFPPIKIGETAIHTASGGVVTDSIKYSSNNASIATVDEVTGVVTACGAGTVEITATRPGNELYKEATATYTLRVTKDHEGFIWNDSFSEPREVVVFESYVSSGECNNSHDTEYKSDDEAYAQINATTGELTAIKANTLTDDEDVVENNVTISANLSEVDIYNKNTYSYELKIKRADPNLAFETPSSNIPVIKYGEIYQNAASVGNTPAGLATDIPVVKYKLSDASDSSVAEVNETTGEVTPKKAGSVTIVAYTEVTSQYKASEVSYNLTIDKADITLSFTNTAVKDGVYNTTFNLNDNKFTNTAKPSVNGLKVTYSVVSGPATVDADTGAVEITGATPDVGDIIIKADFAGNECYNPATAQYTIKVAKATPTVEFSPQKYSIYTGTGDTFVEPVPTDSVGVNSVYTYSVFEDKNNVINTIDENTGDLVFNTEAIGTVIIEATRQEQTNYKSASAQYTLVVEEMDIPDGSYAIVGDNSYNTQWYKSNVSVKAADDYEIGYGKTGNRTWVSVWENAASDSEGNIVQGKNQLKFKVREIGSDIWGAITKETTQTVYIDTVAPSATIKVNELSAWEKFLTIFNTKGESFTYFELIFNDATSGVATAQYYIDTGNTEVKPLEEVKAITSWVSYTQKLMITENQKFVVYGKVTDNAGNVTYVSSNGIVYDNASPTAQITLPELDGKTHYTDNVKVDVALTDAAPYSGIASASYEVFCNDKITQQGTLSPSDADTKAKLEITDPKYDDLTATWVTDGIIIDKDLNNSDNVKVVVKVTDNAGNEATAEESLKISSISPSIAVEYTNKTPVTGELYNAATEATITLTGRNSLFDENNYSVTVEATDKNGNVVNAYEIKNALLDASKEKVVPPSDATRTQVVKFNKSADYTFKVNYVDKLGRPASYEKAFTVDIDAPGATVKIGENSWSKLVESLTFGLWSPTAQTVTINPVDDVSEIKSVEYYVTDSTVRLTENDLKDLAEEKWVPYTFATELEEILTYDNQRLTVYAKITDEAGNVGYSSSNGYITDNTVCDLNITPAEPHLTENGFEIYNQDFDVEIEVEDPTIDGSYSGIKNVVYWGIDGITENNPKTLYEYTYEATHEFKELVNKKSFSVEVDAENNNGNSIGFFVGVTDNAGNYTEKSVNLDIDTSPATIDISYGADSCVQEVDGRGYFNKNRELTITYTERTHHFDRTSALEGIQIIALDAEGNPVSDENGAEFDANGKLKNNSAYVISDWVTNESANIDKTTHTIKLSFSIEANYDLSISYNDIALGSEVSKENIRTGDSVTPYKFTVDKTNPTAEIKVKNSTWTTLVKTLTFGLWSKEGVDITVEPDDITSKQLKTEYYKTDATDVIARETLENIAADEWKEYTGKILVEDNDRFTVYVKVTDTANNVEYFSSNGYIVDKKGSAIELKADKPNENNIYNSDFVNVEVNIDEVNEYYSGIKKVVYWGIDGYTVDNPYVMYEFEYSDSLTADNEPAEPKFDQLIHSFNETVEINSHNNNRSDVEFFVGVTDNAGNYTENSVKLDIDVTAPTIDVTYDNNNAYKIVNDEGYFYAPQRAEIVITERANHFDKGDATNNIVITAVDAQGKTVIEDCTSLISEWKTTDGETPDEAKHTAIIDYSADANYTFEISYTDKAGNSNTTVNIGESVAPYKFTVDTVAPEGTVTVGALGTWDSLIETLTFGLWSRETVKISGTSSDITADVESVSYYKTPNVIALKESELKALPETAWAEFDGFEVVPDEQFTVYLKIVDNSGNTTFISTNGVIVDKTLPEFQPSLENDKPEIVLATVENDINGIYKSDVTMAVKVIDPVVGETYSGLKEIKYTVTNLGKVTQEGVLYSFDKKSPTQNELVQLWENEAAFVIDSKLNNSNDVKVSVYAVDNSGNEQTVETSLKLDITSPVIDVTYNNNDGDTSFNESTYFKANRVATVIVTERNFDPADVVVKITNTDKVIPVLSSWVTAAAGENGDATTHTATITYSADGDYTFDISYVDEAGNANNGVNYGKSLSPQKFTIDKTMPTFSVTYDNNEALNGNYYKAQRVATIVVNEHNFETSRVNIALNATDNGTASALPNVSNWVSVGDVHTATITYAADSMYTFDFDYTDKAGNITADIEQQTFYVDKTNPALSITGVADQSANSGEDNIGFVITATDTNFDTFSPVISVTDISGNSRNVTIGGTTDVPNGRSYVVNNVAEDGIYRITCTLVDKAGNAFTEVRLQRADGSNYVENRAGNETLITFSVNRDGSTYEVNDNTASMLKNYYVQNVLNDIVVVEINADSLDNYGVTLNDKELVNGSDYTVAQTGGNGSWFRYTYTIKKALFASEGEYKLVVESKDRAGNDAFSDIKDTTVNFVVDRTAPIVTVTGMATKGRYQTESQTVTIMPTDDGGALKSLIVRFVDEDGKIIEEIMNLEGEKLEEALEKGAGKLTFEIKEGDRLYQNVQIICNDYAVDADGNTNIYDETFTDISVSSSAFMIFWANKPLRWGVIGGITLIMALIIFFIIKKSKKDENNKDEKNAKKVKA